MEPSSESSIDQEKPAILSESAEVVATEPESSPKLASVVGAAVSSSSSSSSGSSDGTSSDSDSSSGSDSESSSGDDSEDSEEEEVARPVKRKSAAADAAAKKRFRFLDVEADVGSSDEEDEEFIDDEAAAREAREGGRESRELELLRREAEQRRKAGGGNRLQSVIQRLEERAANESANPPTGEASTALVARDEEEYGEGEFESAAGASAAMFPTAEDYKLFFVRMAEPGKEREAVIQLSHKAAEELNNGKECQIRSIFSIDSLRGYVYIEAPNDTVAKNFLMGIRKVQWYNLVVVPQSEMAGVFRAAVAEASAKFKLLQPGEYVRIKRHALYKGDIARVIECHDRDVDLAIVPRIEWFNLGGSGRPTPKLFDDKVVEGLGVGEVERLRNPSSGEVRNHFRGEVFTDEGFLIKRFSRSTLITGDEVHPRIDERRPFRDGQGVSPQKAVKDNRHASEDDDEDEEQDGSARAVARSKKEALVIHAPPTVSGGAAKSVFAVGDVVRVKSGDVKNLIGKIGLIDKVKSVVSIEAPDGLRVQVLEREIEKFFKLSDHVKILTGSSAGDTGIVTAIDGGVCTVLVDEEVREVKVNSNGLQASAEVSKGELALGPYSVGQLVQFRSPVDSIGLIVKISKSGNFALIGIDSRKYSVTVADIEGSKSVRDAMTVSKHGDSIRRGSVVKFFGPGNLVKSGTVKDVYRNSVFIKESEKVTDGGYTVVESRLVELVAASVARHGDASAMSNYTGGGSAPTGQQTGGGGYQSAPSGYRRGGARLEGKRVRIIKGPFKGQLAQVREDHDTRVQVSLEAKFRVVTIPKDCVRLEDEPDLAPTVRDTTTSAPTGNLNMPPAAAMGSLSQPPSGYVPPSSTPFTPAPPHLQRRD